MRGQDLRRSETHSRPFVMGILNVTPDSFSDGGRYTDADAAVEHAFRMIDEGAEIIDIGAESTRPGFTPVPAEEEIARLIPVIERLRQSSDVIISADTMKTETARAAISAGADIINDVNALRWPGMLDLLSESEVPAVVMHMTGSPADTHSQIVEGTVIDAVRDFLNGRIAAAEDRGVSRDMLIIDPGIGFGKTMWQNGELIRNLDLIGIGLPMLVGVSRKRVLATMYPGADADEATVRAGLTAAQKGADILRVHDVGRVAEAVQNMNL